MSKMDHNITDKQYLQQKIDKYPYVYAWAKMMGSYTYYIEEQLNKAIASKAPNGATFERDNKWSTIFDTRNPMALRDMKHYVNKDKAELLDQLANERIRKNAEEKIQEQIDYLVDFLDYVSRYAGPISGKEEFARDFLKYKEQQ